MKLTSLLFIVAISLSYHSNAQTVSKNPDSDAAMKVWELQMKLTLSDQQKKDLYGIFITQNLLADSIKNHSTNNPVKRQQFSDLLAKVNSTIDSLLSPAQRIVYNQWKESQKLTRKRK